MTALDKFFDLLSFLNSAYVDKFIQVEVYSYNLFIINNPF